MCGITGIWPKGAAVRPEVGQLESMIRMLKHRGPDCQRVWEEPGVGLAHARLSIIDLNDRANQPMQDAETNSVIVFNGEIFNYIELREALRGLGYSFQTESDTEVILKAYHAWGTDCLSRFNGMWAFALYDRNRRELFCARDRFGIKPFCYGTTQSGDLVFASEHKVLWTHFPEFAVPDRFFLVRFLNEGTSFSAYKETFYEGISHLLPGHYFVVANGGPVEQKSYYRINPEYKNPPPSRMAANEFSDLLQDSIRLRHRSDVPVGSCLSGGLDSSTIVGLATRASSTPVHTFSCVYPEHPYADESEYIEANIEHFHCQSKTVTPGFEDFIAAVRRATWEQDGPTIGPLVLSQRAVMELASAEVRVLLDGQGADEVLGGYHWFFEAKLRSLAREFVEAPSVMKFLGLWRQKRLQEARTGRRSPQSVRELIGRMRSAGEPHFDARTTAFSSALSEQEPFPDDDLNSLLLEQVRVQLGDILHCEDRSSMAVSVETRLPYLDYRLVDYAFSLPHAYKIRGGKTKVLLHRIAQDILPEKVYRRRDKMGFGTPGRSWFGQKESVDYMGSVLHDRHHPIFSYLSAKKRARIEAIWARMNDGDLISEGDESDVWRIMTTCLWLEGLRDPDSIQIQIHASCPG
jgi:asparagine synthase (glutamine-hydrolysing)